MVADAQRSVDQKVRENDVLTAWLWRTYGAQQLCAEEEDPMMYMSCAASRGDYVYTADMPDLQRLQRVFPVVRLCQA